VSTAAAETPDVRVIRGTCRLPVSAATVWAHLADPVHWAALNPDSIGVEGIEPAGPFQSGQHWTEHARSPLGLQQLAARVESFDPRGAGLHLHAQGPLGLEIDTEVRVQDEGDGSRVTLEHRLHVPRGPWAGLTATLVAARIEDGTAAAVRRLQRNAQGWQDPAAGGEAATAGDGHPRA
jgi:carbon monoxide dehydrogenase subunit G